MSLYEETGLSVAKSGHKANSLKNVGFSGGPQEEKLAQIDEDEEEMLKKAIAMSLEEETGLSFGKGGN